MKLSQWKPTHSGSNGEYTPYVLEWPEAEQAKLNMVGKDTTHIVPQKHAEFMNGGYSTSQYC
jgi:hypothetical protein